MTKKEVIKEAYGEYWIRLTEFQKNFALSGGGYVQIGYNPEQTQLFIDMKRSGLFDLQPTRPRSLRGILNNNGWTKIESEKDLPQDINYAYVVAKDKEILFKSGVSKSTVDYLYATGKITHYQQIGEFKPPIF